MRQDETEPTERPRGAWRLTALTIGALVIAIPALYLAARNQPSALSNQPELLLTPVIGLDEGCDNFARYWLEQSSLSLEPALIEGMTNCRQAADGSWFVPTGPNDPRLRERPVIPDDQRALAERVEAALRQEIDELEASFSDSLQREIQSVYSPRAQPVFGNVSDRAPLARPRSRYGRVVQAFVLDPRHELLAGYIGWVMERRRSAYDAFRTACLGDPGAGYLELPCQGLEDALSIRYPPWPWDLRNDLTMQEYLADRAASGQLEADAALIEAERAPAGAN
jgi:hypothetical protein